MLKLNYRFINNLKSNLIILLDNVGLPGAAGVVCVMEHWPASTPESR